MPSLSLMDHERHRWSYLSQELMVRRLQKITRAEKLECFLDVAYERGSMSFIRLGVDRAYELGFPGLAGRFERMLEASEGGSLLRSRPMSDEREARVNAFYSPRMQEGIQNWGETELPKAKEQERKIGKRVIRIGRKRHEGA